MAEILTASSRLPQGAAPDPRIARSKADLRQFAMLAIPLALLLAIFNVYRLEQPSFLTMAYMVFGGFAVCYWLPFRFKETFTIALSLAGAFVLVGPLSAAVLVAGGLALFLVVRAGIAMRWRVAILLAIAAALAVCRGGGYFPALRGFWPVFGALFMIRMIVYLYDISHMKGPAKLKDFLGYFYLLPNYVFLLFPVVDFQTFRKSYFKRDYGDIAQQGVWWIVRGTTHLLVYRLVYQSQAYFSTDHLAVFVVVMGKIFLNYLLYVRISGQFHIAVGMLHLFGYDLPETNHKYLLANGISDMWRRINIYWKDFMVKTIYLPTYFKLRKWNNFGAQLLATALVFPVTWFLHVWQFFWVQGKVRAGLNDALYWAILGGIVVLDTWRQSKQAKRTEETGWKHHAWNGLQILATFVFISILWSMWSANSLTEWLLFLKTGNAY